MLSIKSSDAKPFSDIIPSHTGSSGSICFGKFLCCYLSFLYPLLFISLFFKSCKKTWVSFVSRTGKLSDIIFLFSVLGILEFTRAREVSRESRVVPLSFHRNTSNQKQCEKERRVSHSILEFFCPSVDCILRNQTFPSLLFFKSDRFFGKR